ncbi:MAG: metallophosphatase domain-containing protein [Planctomycetes bacterium]|jgi:predicted phosphodiesterase|nr:metallophosphatase domain-containing protein [Planctomycetota bacterium]
MRIVCLSDTHDLHDQLQVPDGDLLLHAGDATMRGSEAQIRAFDRWLAGLPHRHKVVIAGNHDWAFERTPAAARSWLRAATYLEDSEVTIDGLRIWGSPWQPWFYDWAFNLERGPAIAAKWDLIPAGIDVLITHGPPAGILDRTDQGDAVGCTDLLAAVRRVRPRLHVFGHIHEAYGTFEQDGVRFVNASNCSVRYRPVQPPIIVDL